jgi:Lon protease-like protein
MSDAHDTTIGLFPLQLVLLPGEILPLHIFEERYKRLVGDCRGDGSALGIILHDDEAVAECGCSAVVHEVLEEFDDGRLNILVEGRERFRVHELIEPDDTDREYLRARIAFFDDGPGGVDVGELAGEAAVLFVRLVTLMGAEDPKVPEGAAPLSFRIATAVDFGAPLKQRLLESVLEADRLELLTAVMRSLIPSLELREERAEAIRGNGKGN